MHTSYIFEIFNLNGNNIALILNTFKATNTNCIFLNLAGNDNCINESNIIRLEQVTYLSLLIYVVIY